MARFNSGSQFRFATLVSGVVFACLLYAFHPVMGQSAGPLQEEMTPSATAGTAGQFLKGRSMSATLKLGKPELGPASGSFEASGAPRRTTRATIASRKMEKSMRGSALTFSPNAGQVKDSTRFLASGRGFALSLEKGGLTFETRVPNEVAGPGKSANSPGATSAAGRPTSAGAGGVPSRVKDIHFAFLGANENAVIDGLDPETARFNYFIGSDPSKWKRNVPVYDRVRYHGLYPGVDMIFYGGKDGGLEYDFVVAAGADPEQIRFHIFGDGKSVLDPRGNLQLDGKDGELSLNRPLIYQDIDSNKKEIAGAFVQVAENEFSFKVNGYDTTKPLIIDPKLTLVYSTYLGGRHEDNANDIVIDSSGNSYIVGITLSQDFPISGNAFQSTRDNVGTYAYDGTVSKFSSSGVLLYSTFIGGATTNQSPVSTSANAIAVDSEGNAYIAGATNATDFPTTTNAYSKTPGAGFFAELSADGSTLEYGSDYPAAIAGIAFNAQGNLVMAGTAAPGLATSKGSYMPKLAKGDAAFAAIFNLKEPAAKQLVAATYYGTDSPMQNSELTGDALIGFAIDGNGNIWIGGQAYTPNLPTTATAYQKSVPALSSTCVGDGAALNGAAFFAELSSDLSKLEYATYFSGKTSGATINDCSEFVNYLVFDSAGNLYASGGTGSASFPVTAGAIQGAYPGEGGYNGYSGWVAKFAPNTPAPVWSTYFGGNGGDTFFSGAQHGEAIDSVGNLWIVGQSQGGSNFPITARSYQPKLAGGYDGFASQISPDGKELLYSTYLGGSGDDIITSLAIDESNDLFLAGNTISTNFPVTPHAFQNQYGEGCASGCDGNDMFFAILGSGAIGTVSPTTGGNTGDTTITVSGAGFESGTICELVMGGTVISSITATVNSAGTSVSCTFALQGVAPGTYDVVVKGPGASGTTLTDKGAYTVESGGATVISVSLTGRSSIRVGTPTTMALNYSNTGTQDAYMTTIWLVLPGSYTYSIPGVTTPVNKQCILLSQLPNNVNYNGYQYIPIIIPVIPGGASGAIQFTVTAPGLAKGQELEAYAETPWFGSLEAATTFLNGVVANPKTASAKCVPDPINPAIDNCFGFVASVAGQEYATYLTSLGGVDGNPAGDVTAELAGQFAALLENPATSTTPTFAWVQLGEASIEAFTKANSSIKQCLKVADLPSFSYKYLPPPKPPQITILCPDEDQMGFGVDFIDDMDPCFPQDDDESEDPNSKTGPSGDRTKNHFIRPVSPFAYNVAFENEAKATLPAAQVVITDQLDPSKVNLSTVTLGAIQFGGHVISPPASVNNFNTTYALSSALNVRIEGSLDQTGGLLKWTFTSIDPSTGLPPTDPTVGFLPPDTNGVIGQGSVVYNVIPKSGLATGTKITNMATVVFDANAPIKTPTWVNTLDTSPPVSKVAALPALQVPKSGKATFKLSWSGTDVGSGIAFYNVYVSDSDGSFKPLLMGTTLTSATYTGKIDHFYGFYSIATDNAGNVEPTKTRPDASTSIPPVKATAELSSSAIKATLGSDIKFTVALSGPESNDPRPTGTVTFFNGSVELGKENLVAGKASISVKTLPLGTHVITADYSGNADYPKDTSNAIRETITKPVPIVKLVSSPNPATAGVKVTFTVTVTGAKAAPTGTVTFYEGGKKRLATATVSGGKAKFATTSLPKGTDAISAVYSGNSEYSEATSNIVKEKIE
jgi:hypothetical protein